MSSGHRGRAHGDELFYPMDNARRGVAAIFNQREFDHEQTGTRTRSKLDVLRMSKTFTKLGFDVEVYKDLTAQQIDDRLNELSARDHSDCDCFVLIFMSHGVEGILLAKDKAFDVNLLWDSFTGEACPSLATKPKVFFIQACQGPGRQGGVNVYSADSRDSQTLEDRQTVKLMPSYQLPKGTDFLVALASTPGVYSWRNRLHGSWFIEDVYRQLYYLGFKLDLVTLLTRVNRQVALDRKADITAKRTVKQMSSFISLLVRKLKFTDKNKGCKIIPIKMSHLRMKEFRRNEEEEIVKSRSLLGRLNDRRRRMEETSGDDDEDSGRSRSLLGRSKDRKRRMEVTSSDDNEDSGRPRSLLGRLNDKRTITEETSSDDDERSGRSILLGRPYHRRIRRTR